MVYIFLAEGFEEIEVVTPVDILKRADIDIKLVSMTDSIEVTGGHGITLIADEIFDETDFADAEILVLPGGNVGTENLAKHDGLKKLIIEQNNKNKFIAAICAAPTILGELGILEGKKATCYPGLENALKGAQVESEMVVQDGNLVTSKGPGTAQNFGLRIVSILKGKELAEKLNESTLFKRKFEVIIKER